MDPSTCMICSFAGPGLHRFPRDKKRLKDWLIAIERTDLLESEHSSTVVSNSGRLCNAHFADSCFCGKDKKKLAKHALPRLCMEESTISKNPQDINPTECDNNDGSKERLCDTMESSSNPGNSSIEDEQDEEIARNQPAACENGDLKSRDIIYPAEKLIQENIFHAINSNKEVEKILGATNITGELMLLVKWKGLNEADLVPSTFAKKHFPGLLIEFYEERLMWTTAYQAETGANTS